MSAAESLVNGFGRLHRSLRLSVTDRCNLRCRYCMPAEGMKWLPREELLTDEELLRVVSLFARMGISEIRVTGGEPLVRPGLPALIGRITATPGRARGRDDHQRGPPRRHRGRPGGQRPQPAQREHRLARPRALRAHHPPPRPRPGARGPRRVRAPRVAAADQGERGRPAGRQRARRAPAGRAGPAPAVRRALHRGDAARRAARVDPRLGPVGRGAAGDDRREVAPAADGPGAGVGHGHQLAVRRRGRDAPVRLVGHRAVLRELRPPAAHGRRAAAHLPLRRVGDRHPRPAARRVRPTRSSRGSPTARWPARRPATGWPTPAGPTSAGR